MFRLPGSGRSLVGGRRLASSRGGSRDFVTEAVGRVADPVATEIAKAETGDQVFPVVLRCLSQACGRFDRLARVVDNSRQVERDEQRRRKPGCCVRMPAEPKFVVCPCRSFGFQQGFDEVFKSRWRWRVANV